MVDDLTKHKAVTSKMASKMLKPASTDVGDIDMAGIPKLMEELEHCHKRHEDLKDWAEKFGLADAAKKTKRKKT